MKVVAMRFLSLLMLCIVVPLSSCGGGGGGDVSLIGAQVAGAGSAAQVGEIADRVRRPLAASNAAIERAKVALAQTPQVDNVDLHKNLEDAQAAIRDVMQQQAEASLQLNLFQGLTNEVLKAKIELEEEKRMLQQEKEVLERRETVWQASMLIAVFTAIAAVVAGALKYPLMKLDVQLKRIEIRERELELLKAIARQAGGEEREGLPAGSDGARPVI